MEKRVVAAFLFILIFPAVLLALSGNPLWPEGWIFSLWLIILSYSVILYLDRNDPACSQNGIKSPVPATSRDGTGSWSGGSS